MRAPLAAALLSAAALPALAQQQPMVTPAEAPAGQVQAKAAIAECDRLVSLIGASPSIGVTEEQARAWKQASDAQACRTALDRFAEAQSNAARSPSAPIAEGAQPALTSAAPQVIVQQAQPNVTVRQPQPEIIVRIPPPVITVQQPQPEIVVRMPEPDVTVAMASPEVQVTIPQPQVQVQPPGPQGPANVQVERQQPNLRIERTGEPRIVYQQAEGQPQIRFEPVGPGGGPTQAPTPLAQLNTPQGGYGAGSGPQATGAVAPPTQALAVSRLEDLDLYSARDQKLGDVEAVVTGADGRQFLVVSYGGFLGLGERQVAVPLERVGMRGDRLVADGLTDDELRALPRYDRSAGYQEVQAAQTAPLRTLR